MAGTYPSINDKEFDLLKKIASNTALIVDTGGGAPGPGGSGAWGLIIGTLSDQTDLQAALDAKVPTTRQVNGHALTSNVTVTKGDVGLGNADNTADANKPISTATQTALDGKVAVTRTVNGHALSADVTVTKGDVGLGNVDNTSDASKPISTATQTALDGKVPTTRTVAGHDLSADVTLVKGDVGLGNVDNTSDANKPVSTAAQTALDGKVPITRTVNGHALSADVTVTKSDLSLGNVDNTSDANKPISTATQTALDAKVPVTRTVNGYALSSNVTITKSDLSLGNVDNTSDANKPVSTATQTALDLKANLLQPETTIASASTTDLGSVSSQNVSITGTTTITSFGTASAGTIRAGRFTGVLTLTYNATSLILPGQANITTAAGDSFRAVSLGSGNWVVTVYTKVDGTPLYIGSLTFSTNAGQVTLVQMPTSSGASSGTPMSFKFLLGTSTVFEVYGEADGSTGIQNTKLNLNGGQLNRNLSVYASGTVYSLTGSQAAVDFGTTDPALTIDQAGTWRIRARMLLKYNNATFAANQTATMKLRRTNNTAADLTNASTAITTEVLTTTTKHLAFAEIEADYTTNNGNDSIALYGALSALPGNSPTGTVDVVEASIMAVRLY